ncbi:hypothetical protein B0H16DRAFT_1475034 [Mycena metata]|uniref:Beta-lactamase-related domain-containing protein n=1 Tax=Mycena metata TaxID=1033252 RepID=A0AAD7MIP9_9AGAR|nr:hypothetical protein B0H16DRAFT_1475034 [Mycena metata]
MQLWQSTIVGLISLILGGHYTGFWALPKLSIQQEDTERFSCRHFLPTLFDQSPPQADNPLLKVASLRAAQFLESRNYGVMRGNESESSPSTNSDSVYRLASVSKLFTVLEGHILAEKGVISWNDPVDKYLPHFRIRLDKSSNPGPSSTSITLFQLAQGWDAIGRRGMWPTGPRISLALGLHQQTGCHSQSTGLFSAP